MYPEVVLEIVPGLEHSFLAALNVLGKLLAERPEELRCRKSGVADFSLSPATAKYVERNGVVDKESYLSRDA
jgi:hypothetical protein